MSKIIKELKEAIKNTDSKELEAILLHNPDINYNTKKSIEVFYQLLDYVYEPVIEKAKLLLDYGFDVNQKKNSNSYSLLHMAVSYGDPDLVEEIVNRKANINERDNKFLRTPLHFSKNSEITTLLINAGADLNAKDIQGISPLLSSLMNPSVSFPEEEICKQVKLILDAGADINSTDNYGNTTLLIAISFPLRKCVDLILKYYPDVNCQNDNGHTALSLAINIGSIDIVRVLIDLGADIDLVNPHDLWSPLFIATNRGNVRMVEILMEAGANKNLMDKNGKTPIHYTRNKKIVELLK
ncbi:ankyrin repeat domain-containing protein [uncultured Psychroserpens sp.]|uniref:ankyrin repeat domain-containing protein n=1 Tax=uncultured Psychroserpens sp. TaxID=255436 RepID=UPI0026319FA8|nr:ankyrin repeat domain-containing protein [uncultured Psychroserpens sp.]